MINCARCGDLGYVMTDDGNDPCPQCSATTGRKFDGFKPDYSLLPFDAIEPVVDVLTYGANKYERDNWRRVRNADQRYIAAALRHISAYQQGEELDQETLMPHVAHAVCCLLFILGKKDHEQDERGRADGPGGEPAGEPETGLDEGGWWGGSYCFKPSPTVFWAGGGVPGGSSGTYKST
jgi:hypothetical protein